MYTWLGVRNTIHQLFDPESYWVNADRDTFIRWAYREIPYTIAYALDEVENARDHFTWNTRAETLKDRIVAWAEAEGKNYIEGQIDNMFKNLQTSFKKG